MNIYRLEKNIWSVKDFEKMGWHDNPIHAISYLPDTYEFQMDIDYIFQWDEIADSEHFNFSVAPCTLVFKNVNELKIDLEPQNQMQIMEITKENPGTPRNVENIDENTEWEWCIETLSGQIGFKSVGYKMYVRYFPIVIREQVIDLKTRKGISFDRPNAPATIAQQQL